MVQYCSVSGCSSRSRRDLVAFFRFPTVRKRFGLDLQEMIKLRREKWVDCIPRFKNVPEDKFKHARVCANHFISGKPAPLQDVDDPDWVPSLNLRLEPRRVRLRRLAARDGVGPAPPRAGEFGTDRPESEARSTNDFLGQPRIKPESQDSDSEDGYRDVPNKRFLEPEVEIEELDCRTGAEDGPHRYGCPLCKTTFRLQEELRTHLNTHRGGVGVGHSHPCVVCCINLASKAELQEHWVRWHSLNLLGKGRGESAPTENSHGCSSCAETFAEAEELLRHRNAHTEESARCRACDGALFGRTRLGAHGRRFGCSLCGRGFHSKAVLRQHLSCHAAGKDLFDRCGECRRHFATEEARGRHRLSAHPTPVKFTCAHCDMDFPNAGRLAQHATCHTGETAHAAVAGETYYHLQDQTKQHAAVLPYRCHLCPLAFTQRTYLKSHLDGHAVAGD